mgnify:CR=1 FL=1
MSCSREYRYTVLPSVCLIVTGIIISGGVIAYLSDRIIDIKHDNENGVNEYNNQVGSKEYSVIQSNCTYFDSYVCVDFYLSLKDVQSKIIRDFTIDCDTHECSNAVSNLFRTELALNKTINLKYDIDTDTPCLTNSYILQNCPEEYIEESFTWEIIGIIVSLLVLGIWIINVCLFGLSYYYLCTMTP